MSSNKCVCDGCSKNKYPPHNYCGKTCANGRCDHQKITQGDVLCRVPNCSRKAYVDSNGYSLGCSVTHRNEALHRGYGPK